MTKTVIFVLGMGRSGTSVLARLLSLCGGALPDRLLVGAVHSNAKGHWEPKEALDLNDRFLLAHRATHSDRSRRGLMVMPLSPRRGLGAVLRVSHAQTSRISDVANVSSLPASTEGR